MNIPPELAAFISSNPDDILKQWSSYENGSYLDYCSYYIYCDEIDNILSRNVIDIYENIKSFISDKIKGYIWHKDKFNLQIIIPSNDNNGKESPIYLHGLVKYGDNIEDEWYIVFLLIEISKRFANLSIKVVDAEGEFLLIEAADYLPKWIGPENSENRVWIRNGMLHIISPEDVGSSMHSGIKISQAIDALQRSDTILSTCADAKIQKCIKNRTVDVYPRKAKASEFNTICYVPINVASLLHSHPELLNIAVESFCSSDKSNTKHTAAMSLFERDLKLDEMITVSIRFTRALYAQMTFKEFHPPKKFHKVMNTINASCSNSETLRLVKQSFDIGTRLTVGLEIAYQKSRVESVKNKSYNERSNVEYFINAMKKSNRLHVDVDPSFVNSLKTKYFDGNIIMSKKNDYNKASQLLNEESVDNFNEDYTDPFSINPIHWIIGNHLAKRASDPSLDKNNLHYAKVGDGDSDDWMYLSPEDFEKEMNERMKNVGATVFKTETDSKADAAAKGNTRVNATPANSKEANMKSKIEQLDGVVKGVKEFMNMKSTIDGIDIENDAGQDDLEEDDKDAMFSGIENINFKDIMEQLLKISSENIEHDINEYFSSDDDDVDDDNVCDKNNTHETINGIKNIILSNDKNDNDNDNDDKDSDDEDSFYNDSDSNDSDDIYDNNDNNDTDDFMNEYAKQMDSELSSTTLAESFEMISNSENETNDVDIEKNLLKYLMESHASQLGMPGPATQLLSQLNLSLPLPPPLNTKDH